MLHDKSRRRTAVRSDGDTNLKRNVILAVLFIVLLITAIEVREAFLLLRMDAQGLPP